MQCPGRQYEIHELNKVCAPYGRNSSLLYNSLHRGFLVKEKVDQIQCSVTNSMIGIIHFMRIQLCVSQGFAHFMQGRHFNEMLAMPV
jgi:hypothetical protein